MKHAGDPGPWISRKEVGRRLGIRPASVVKVGRRLGIRPASVVKVGRRLGIRPASVVKVVHAAGIRRKAVPATFVKFSGADVDRIRAAAFLDAGASTPR